MKIYIALLALCAIIALFDGTEGRFQNNKKKVPRKLVRKIVPLVRKVKLINRKVNQFNESDFAACASDGTTFTNKSELLENLLANKNISLVHPGKCLNCSVGNVCKPIVLPKISRKINNKTCEALIKKCEAFRDNGTVVGARGIIKGAARKVLKKVLQKKIGRCPGCLVRKIQTKKVPNAPEENPEDPQENLDDPELEIPEEGPVVPNITK